MGSTVDTLGLEGRTVEQIRFDACVDEGGFGLVYRGHHLGLDEPVAIKCLRMAAMEHADAEIRESITGRFRDETKLLYRLSQGNLDIVRCIGSGTLIAPKTRVLTPYMVLEWLDGETLSDDLRRRASAGLGGRTLDEAVRLLEPAALAVAYAHERDVVHRDIKPGNLFLARSRSGVRVKVLDFGLAKILSDEGLGVRPSVATSAGHYFCSPAYGAPEQFSPEVGPVGPWTDVYSFTLVVLELLRGAKVRRATSLAEGLLEALEPRTGSPSPKALGLDLSPALDALLTRALAQRPFERPRDVGVLWRALTELAQPGPAILADGTRPPLFADTVVMPNAPGAGKRAGADKPVSPLASSVTKRPSGTGTGTEPLARPLDEGARRTPSAPPNPFADRGSPAPVGPRASGPTGASAPSAEALPPAGAGARALRGAALFLFALLVVAALVAAFVMSR